MGDRQPRSCPWEPFLRAETSKADSRSTRRNARRPAPGATADLPSAASEGPQSAALRHCQALTGPGQAGGEGAPKGAGLRPLTQLFGDTILFPRALHLPGGLPQNVHHLHHHRTGLAPHSPCGRQPSLLTGPLASSHYPVSSDGPPCSVNTQPP